LATTWVPDVAPDAHTAAASLCRAIEVSRAELDSFGYEVRPPTFRSAPIASVAAADLNVRVLREALQTDAALVVRGLLSPERCARAAALISAARAERDRFDECSSQERARSGPRSADEVFVPLASTLAPAVPLAMLQDVARLCQAVLVAEAPAVLDELMLVLAETRLLPLVAEHLGESPAVSVDKLLVRSAAPEIPRSFLPEELDPGWHQDGADWDPGTRSLNVWIAFDDCGPGTGRRSMEVFPKPVNAVVPPALGVDPSAHVDAIRALQREIAPAALSLAAGDAVLFDHLNVHRSEGGRQYTATRRSAEFWFFAPSTFPAQVTPMLIQRAG
jgi:hypothetical protein